METTTFDPTRWRIAQSFTHKGIVRSPGEPVPADLTPEEVDTLWKEHCLARVSETGTEMAGLPTPETIEQWLSAADIMVLRRIRKFRPKKQIIRGMIQDLDRSGRAIQSPILYEALRALVGDELGKEEALY